jgi:hypothetical protein
MDALPRAAIASVDAGTEEADRLPVACGAIGWSWQKRRLTF